MHYLATRASAQEIRVIMGQMSSVVEAMLDRLKVELATDEFAVALEAFNISAWSSEPNHDQLSSHFRALCKLLKSGRARCCVLFGVSGQSTCQAAGVTQSTKIAG